MMRIPELPGAIRRAVNGWRIWVTLLLLSALILNEAALGIREGQTIVESLTRVPNSRMPLLIFVCAVIAQAAIGAIPFTIGVTMTMLDFALRRRQAWREEGREAGLSKGREEGKELGREEGKELGRAVERQQNIAAIVADPFLTDTAKLQAIAAINAAAEAR